MSTFGERIAECRDRFSGGRRDLLRAESRNPPATGGAEEQVPSTLKNYYQMLLDRGTIVWAAVAQVNRGMLSAGRDDLPGVTVYSTDDYFDDHPQDLADIAHAAYALKDTEPDDAELRAVADRMTDEYDMTVRQPLPYRLTDRRLVYIAATLFHRARLPGAVLSARLVPVVIGPEYTDVNMILPLLCWSPDLRACWKDVDAQIATLPMTSTATRVAREAQVWRVQPADPWADRPVVRITAEAARAFHEAIARHEVRTPYLCLGLRADGRKTADLGESYDSTQERCFEVDGIQVIIRIDQLDQLRGAVVDFQDGLYGKGFIIRLAGE
jgi:Fe-S cluster assembly iron-binding protein IscA